MVAGHPFPLYSAGPGSGERVGEFRGRPLFRRLANNVLWLIDPVDALPGWRDVGAKPRWNEAAAGDWRPNDASMQRIGDHRWWGARHHVRIWHRGDHAIGQAHVEDWYRMRHRVLGLSLARDSIVEAAQTAGCRVRYVDVESQGTSWDGRVAVIDRA